MHVKRLGFMWPFLFLDTGPTVDPSSVPPPLYADLLCLLFVYLTVCHVSDIVTYDTTCFLLESSSIVYNLFVMNEGLIGVSDMPHGGV
jgi:hypothetical protein